MLNFIIHYLQTPNCLYSLSIFGVLYCILNIVRNLRGRAESVDYQNSKYILEILKNITNAKSLIIKKYKLLFKYKCNIKILRLSYLFIMNIIPLVLCLMNIIL